MIDVAALECMTAPEFREWLIARLSEQAADPIYQADREGAEDFVIHAHQTGSRKLKARISTGLVTVFRDALERDANLTGPLGTALWNASEAAFELKLAKALPLARDLVLLRGHGSGTGVLPLMAERSLLRLILALQPDERAWAPFWLSLWEQKQEPELWAIATAGLRRSDPVTAVSTLPLAVERSRTATSWTLANLLLAFNDDPQMPPGLLAETLNGLRAGKETECRMALNALEEGLADEIMGHVSPESAFQAFLLRLTRPRRREEARLAAGDSGDPMREYELTVVYDLAVTEALGREAVEESEPLLRELDPSKSIV
jgi:hypothetical protein